MASFDPAFARRVVSGLVLVLIALGLLCLGLWPFAGLLVLASALMAIEWQRLIGACFGRESGLLAGWSAAVISVGIILLAGLGYPGAALVVAVGGIVLGGGLATLLGAQPLWAALGVAWLGMPMLALIWLRAIPERGLGLVVWLLVVVWATDTLAYVVGRRLRGPRLAPDISPGKTWSGLCGGVVGGALAGGLAAAAGGSGRLVQAAGLGAAFAVVGQVGDLAESALKRRAGVKDSGSLIPGHGGVLDRLDSLLFTAPVLAILALILGPRSLIWY
ncbi:MAG: phosphatidate cytidylyltransferase [Geminicoccaceae bacterium]